MLKKGLKLQKDENGVDGIATPKNGDSETKEIRVGKRLSASKIKNMDFGDDPDKNELNAQMEKNRSGLAVTANSKARFF